MCFNWLQGGSNMTGTDLCVNKPVTVPVIFEPPCILTTVTSASSSGALPDDGDWTKLCRGCLDVYFNIVFKAVLLCISWWMENFDNIKMHGTTVEKKNCFATQLWKPWYLESILMYLFVVKCSNPQLWYFL